MSVCRRRCDPRVLSDDCLIDETEVEVRPEKIPRNCLDGNVCISQIKKFFTFDGLSLMTEVVAGNYAQERCLDMQQLFIGPVCS